MIGILGEMHLGIMRYGSDREIFENISNYNINNNQEETSKSDELSGDLELELEEVLV